MNWPAWKSSCSYGSRQSSIPYSLNIDGRRCRIIHNNEQCVCTNFHGLGHSRRKCPEIECRRCKNKGHIASDCEEPEPTSDIPQTNETVQQHAPEDISDDISDPSEENPPQTEPDPDLPSPPQENNTENPPPENDLSNSHMEDEEAQRSGTKRPHQTDSDSDHSALPRRSKIHLTPNLNAARPRDRKSKQKNGKPLTEWLYYFIVGLHLQLLFYFNFSHV